MRNIKSIQTWELQRDLYDSLADIVVCEEALVQGIAEYSGGSVKERIEKNKQLVEVIENELKLRS